MEPPYNPTRRSHMGDSADINPIDMPERQTLDGEYLVGKRVALPKNTGGNTSHTLALDPEGDYEILTRDPHPDRATWLRFTVKQIR
jgi:hypothetical protein